MKKIHNRISRFPFFPDRYVHLDSLITLKLIGKSTHAIESYLIGLNHLYLAYLVSPVADRAVHCIVVDGVCCVAEVSLCHFNAFKLI